MKLSLHSCCNIYLTVKWRKKVGDDVTVPFTSNSECLQWMCLLFEWIQHFLHGRPNNETIFFPWNSNDNSKPPKKINRKKGKKKELYHLKKALAAVSVTRSALVQLQKYFACLLAPTIAAEHVLNCPSGYLIIHFMLMPQRAPLASRFNFFCIFRKGSLTYNLHQKMGVGETFNQTGIFINPRIHPFILLSLPRLIKMYKT